MLSVKKEEDVNEAGKRRRKRTKRRWDRWEEGRGEVEEMKLASLERG